ncbi:MAG: squalene/phytoene synthase family protein [Rhodospirillales bacterium]|nr:squalene/phytoene synthase family protein [Rhodospirillales bacterium]MDE2318912.1 squalene/phytoene synthase family protein [Rhodospirillales bacterium]
MSPSSDETFLSRLRPADPDRHFATLFAPARARENLALLYLFNHELARAREVASNQMLALIRLQWWREVVQGQRREHDLARPLADALDAGRLPREDLLALIDAREVEADDQIPDLPSFLAYARGTGGRLARLAGKLLGADSAAIEDLGTAYAISGILRSAPFLARQERSLLPVDGTAPEILMAEAKALLAAKPLRGAFAAWAPAAFVRRDLTRPYAQRNFQDRLAVLRAAFMGRA